MRGEYTNLLAKGTNVAIIDRALHEHFPDSKSVNRALRTVLTIRDSLQATALASSTAKRKAA